MINVSAATAVPWMRILDNALYLSCMPYLSDIASSAFGRLLPQKVRAPFLCRLSRARGATNASTGDLPQPQMGSGVQGSDATPCIGPRHRSEQCVQPCTGAIPIRLVLIAGAATARNCSPHAIARLKAPLTLLLPLLLLECLL